MFRLILFFMFVVSAQLSFGVEQHPKLIKIVILSESQKFKIEEKRKQEEDLKLLVTAYDKLSDAIAADDLSTVQKLFNETPNLKSYAHHNEGTPLHFVRSLTMAQLLIEKIGFDANRGDEWGERPSKTILATKDQFFAHPQEKMAITSYLKSHEKRFAKIYFQLKNNKNLHRGICAFGLATVLFGLDLYFFAKLSHSLTWR